jgi:hypothetical protein
MHVEPDRARRASRHSRRLAPSDSPANGRCTSSVLRRTKAPPAPERLANGDRLHIYSPARSRCSTARRLEEFNWITVRIFNLNLRAAGAFLHFVSEKQPRGFEGGD